MSKEGKVGQTCFDGVEGRLSLARPYQRLGGGHLCPLQQVVERRQEMSGVRDEPMVIIYHPEEFSQFPGSARLGKLFNGEHLLRERRYTRGGDSVAQEIQFSRPEDAFCRVDPEAIVLEAVEELS